jgi:superfamily I DNA/RNA helicase
VKISADLQTSGLDVKGNAPIHGVEIKRTMAMLYTIQLGPGNPQFPDAIDLGKRRIKRAVYRQIFSGSLPAPRDLETGLREWLSEDSPADDIPTATKKELRNFLRNLDELREMMSSKPISPPQLIQEIMSRFLGKSYQMVSNEDQDSTRKVSPYLLVHAVAENEPDLDSLIITLEELRSAGVGDLPNAISLITIHRAKGLEFDHVFIPCIRDDTFPNLKVSSDLEHDYRLYYVAITRCKNRLVLSQYRDQKQDSLSLFLSLIPENLRNLSR